MSNTNDYYKKQEESGKGSTMKRTLYKPLTFFLIIVAIIFVMSVFFKITKIDVQGNSRYSDEEIIAASGIQTGDNLFFINRIAAGSRVVVKLPYVDSVSITRGLPNLCTIIVEESSAVGYVSVGDEYWTVSQSGKFLSSISEEETGALARISGISVSNAEVGEGLTVAEGEEGKLSYLLDILYQIQARGLTSKVMDIDISSADNPQFEFEERFIVKLGANENTEYKFGKLLSAVEQLGVSEAGTLDLSTDNKVNFSPN